MHFYRHDDGIRILRRRPEGLIFNLLDYIPEELKYKFLFKGDCLSTQSLGESDDSEDDAEPAEGNEDDAKKPPAQRGEREAQKRAITSRSGLIFVALLTTAPLVRCCSFLRVSFVCVVELKYLPSDFCFLWT